MKKIHFYEGMTPTPKNFDDLQQHAEDNIKRNLAEVTGVGVLEGLSLQMDKINAQSATLTVSPGKAVAKDGTLLVLTNPVTKTITTNQDEIITLRAQTPRTTATITDIKGTEVWLGKEDIDAEIVITNEHKYQQRDNEVVLGGHSNYAIIDTHLWAKREKEKPNTGWGSNLHRQEAHGWRTLQNHIADSIDTLRKEIAAAKTEAIDRAIPVGFLYIQFPGQKAPKAGTYPAPKNKKVTISESDALGWPGTWQLTTQYADAFFRAEGSDNTAAYLSFTDTGAQPFDNQSKPQPDAGRNITGEFSRDSHSTGLAYQDSCNGAFQLGNWRKRISQTQEHPAHTIKFDASRSWEGKKHTAEEFRPVNYTIRIWKRIS